MFNSHRTLQSRRFLRRNAMFGKIAAVAAALIVATSAHANEWDIGAASWQRNEALQVGRVLEGTVVQVREVNVAPTTSANAVSTGVGGILGGAIGAKMGKGNGRYVAGALSAVLGGVVGNAVGEKVMHSTAQEVIVRKGDGGLIAVTQAESGLHDGQPVYLVESYGKVRAIPRNEGM
jgi:outer membrane lipoprotein SlyB